MAKPTPTPTPKPSIQGNQPYVRGRSSSIQNTDYEEFASLQLDKPNESELKTSEEMKKHMYDDHFEGRPIERAMHILTIGEEVQKLSVIRNLSQLLSTDEEGCMLRVIPKIQQALNTATTEFHVETARSYLHILEKKTVAPNTFAKNFLPSVIFHTDNRDQVAANAWMDTLLAATEFLPLDIVKSNIFSIALNKGQISQNVNHRIASCKLLGKISSRIETPLIKKDILPVVLSLCQDVNETVRANICSQLHIVAKSVPADMLKSALIPILVELGRDETVQVRVEAIDTIVKIIPILNPELIKTSIIPLMRKIFEQAIVSVDDTLVAVAKNYGSLCIGLEAVLNSSEKLWLVTYYHNLCHMGIPLHGAKKDNFFPSHVLDRINSRYIECRQSCAYNFPAMAKFCSSSSELLEKIYPSLCDFSTDPFYMVRKTIGAGMHEVARILGKNNRVVKNQVMTLLWDNMEEVLMGIVPNLGKTIEHLISSGVLGQEQDAVTFELGRGLLQCDKTIRDKTHNWRLYSSFINQLESIVKCLPSDYIYSHFVTLMFEKMHRARPLPCRLAAARTLLIFLRYNLKTNQRQEIRSRLQSEFCLSSSCYKRMLYLRLCTIAREIFSRAYFKEHFFFPLLSRSEDKVANNRLLLIRQLPSLKAMIVMPTEKKYLQTLETCVRSMAVSEKDKDVTAELKLSIHRLDKTETLTEGSTNQTQDDVEDKRRFDEEMRVASSSNRPGGTFQYATQDPRRAPRPEVPKSGPPQRSGEPAKPFNASTVNSSSSNTPNNSPRAERLSYSSNSNQVLPFHSGSSQSANSAGHHGNVQTISNTTNNLISIRSSFISANKTNVNQSCTCHSTAYTRSQSLRNLNLLALVDSNFIYSQKKLSEVIHQQLCQDPRLKLMKSSRYKMEISWLNLETDLKNELYALVKNRQIQGDRNYKEKNKFLTDFRNYNESNLSKFLCEDRDFKETIYNVTGVGMSSEKNDTNFFEERLNFFERKLKMDEEKTNNSKFGNCSCIQLTTNRNKFFEVDEIKKLSYFSKNFEEDFYRDAGVKANEIMGRKMTGIPVYEKPAISTPQYKITTANKRKTWFGNENLSPAPVKLEIVTGYPSKNLQRKKSDTLPSRENISLQKLGIGPRSKSFVLPSTSIQSKDKKESDFQGFRQKENGLSKCDENSSDERFTKNFKSDANPNRFGFRLQSREESVPKTDSKIDRPTIKTRIPINRGLSETSPGGSRSASPVTTKDKSGENIKNQTNSGKKIPVVVSRKSMLIQSNSVKNQIKNNRRSLDSSKISLANMDKGMNLRKKNDKFGGKEKSQENDNLENRSGVREEKGEGETANNSGFSKLPVR